jgi:hypothetical protein
MSYKRTAILGPSIQISHWKRRSRVWQILQSLLRQARIGQSRTSVINPLQWTLAIVVIALLFLVLVHAPSWLLIFFACVVGIVVVLLIAAFLFFMLKNPDALRSEKYSLVKTAIEKKVVGDSLTGLREVMNTFEDSSPTMLGPENSGNIGRKND